MRSVVFIVGMVAVGVVHGSHVVAYAQDELAAARQHYNAGRFDEATALATRAWQQSKSAAAAVVLARSKLEWFRTTGDRVDLESARDLLRAIDPRPLPPAERSEWELGIAGALYLSGDFGPAAEILDRLLHDGAAAGADRDRLVDWWANAVDRVAQALPREERTRRYTRLMERLALELSRHPESVASAYWMVAAARGAGDANRAWNLAVAGWVRAGRAGGTLRADLDRLVLQGVIPDLAAARTEGSHDFRVVIEAMVELASRWEEIKEQWASL